MTHRLLPLRPLTRLLAAALLMALSALTLAPAGVEPAAGEVWLLNRAGLPVRALHDGDSVRLQAALPERATRPTAVGFYFSDGGALLGACTVPAGRAGCTTAPVRTLGWHWDPDGLARPTRQIAARVEGVAAAHSGPLQVAARPVVFAHGFNSSWEAWTNYLGPDGYLAAVGLEGFAVGDGQVPGVMNTGSLLDPQARTNTIAENAAQMGEYIDAVQQATGAEMVDLVAHSMGGLISRYYLDRVMAPRDVAQLITLGTPQAGTECSVLPAALGVSLPATLEIRPSFVTGIFNPQITRRQGVPVFAIAGTPIRASLGSPCTGVPSDLIISLESAGAVPVNLTEVDEPHHTLNISAEVFGAAVLPLLQAPAGTLRDEPDPPASAAVTPAALQFAHVITGHVAQGGSGTYTVELDPGLSVASFALFDLTRSLTVTVVGASGNTIALDATTNGLVVVDDPATLLYLGYGFDQPAPGPWQITLHATGQTPPAGADFALTAKLEGGATLDAQVTPLLPAVGGQVDLSARLLLAGQALPLESVTATAVDAEGETETIAYTVSGAEASAAWQPPAAGLYGVNVVASARLPDGTLVERSAFLAVEAHAPAGPNRTAWVAAGLLLCCGLLGGVGVLGAGALFARRRAARARPAA